MNDRTCPLPPVLKKIGLQFRIWEKQYRVNRRLCPIKSLCAQSPYTFLWCHPQSIAFILMVQDGALALTSMFQAVGWEEMGVGQG